LNVRSERLQQFNALAVDLIRRKGKAKTVLNLCDKIKSNHNPSADDQ